MSTAQTWPESAMTADERRALRAIDREAARVSRQAPSREAFVASIAEAHAKHLRAVIKAQRAKNPLHLTDAGVTWLLAVPGGLIGLATTVLFGWTVAHW